MERGQDAYEPTPRSHRQGRFPRVFPPLAGLLAVTFVVRDMGVVNALIIGAITVAVTLLLVELLIARGRRRLEDRARRDGCSLVAGVKYDVDASGAPRDLNHRTSGNIASGGGENPVPATGFFEGAEAAWRVTPHRSKHREGLRDFAMDWSDVLSAEVLVLRRSRWSVLFITTRDGARYRFQIFARAERVREMLRVGSVPEWKPGEASDLRVSDAVRVRDGREGKIVALSPREREPGRVEVFVRFGTGEVESWDASEVVLVERDAS